MSHRFLSAISIGFTLTEFLVHLGGIVMEERLNLCYTVPLYFQHALLIIFLFSSLTHLSWGYFEILWWLEQIISISSNLKKILSHFTTVYSYSFTVIVEWLKIIYLESIPYYYISYYLTLFNSLRIFHSTVWANI